MNKLIFLSVLSLCSMVAMAYGGMYMQQPYMKGGMSYGYGGYGGGAGGGIGGGGMMNFFFICKYSKTCLKRPLKKNTKIGFQYRLSLNAGQKYRRMPQGEHSAILRPSLSYHFSLRPLFRLFLSGRFRHVLL